MENQGARHEPWKLGVQAPSPDLTQDPAPLPWGAHVWVIVAERDGAGKDLV